MRTFAERQAWRDCEAGRGPKPEIKVPLRRHMRKSAVCFNDNSPIHRYAQAAQQPAPAPLLPAGFQADPHNRQISKSQIQRVESGSTH